jgi:hypothetical protein
MNTSTWLFLYLAGLMELAVRYRLSTGHWLATLIALTPLLAMAAPRTQSRALQCAGAAIAMLCSIVMARTLSLDFWDMQRVDLSLLSAGVGLGGLLAIRDDNARPDWSIVNWLVVCLGWVLALWHPLGPWIAMGPAASLTLWPRAREPAQSSGSLSATWVLFWIGMAISKLWWDSDDWGQWFVALWAIGVACTYFPIIRSLRLPIPVLVIALFPLVYPWIPNSIWAPSLGLLSGPALQNTVHPWRRYSGYALLAGMLLSYAMHSNLELFGPLVWGSR